MVGCFYVCGGHQVATPVLCSARLCVYVCVCVGVWACTCVCVLQHFTATPLPPTHIQTHLYMPLQVISASSDSTVRIWDAKSCECTHAIRCVCVCARACVVRVSVSVCRYYVHTLAGTEVVVNTQHPNTHTHTSPPPSQFLHPSAHPSVRTLSNFCS